MIQDEIIVGRHIIYCISEIRIYIVAFIQRYLSTQNFEYDDVCNTLMNISTPILRPLKNNHSSTSSSCTLISDLLPTFLSGWHRLYLVMKKTSPEIINYSSGIIDTLISPVDGSNSILLASLNCIVEAYTCLSSDQVRSLQVQVIVIKDTYMYAN